MKGKVIFMTLEEFFKKNPKVALGFSGGVDSSYLLYAAKQYGAQIRPYYIKTAFQPEFEYEDAKKIAEQLEIEMITIETDVLQNDTVVANPKNRCYYCKNVIFSTLIQQAKTDGYTVILDGTNASDQVDDRPGMKALEELQVKSPLRECGLTKDKIRELSKQAGLFTWDKPAYACLATRIPTGDKITRELLHSIEKSEEALAKLGFVDFRVRVFHGAAKIQLKEEQLTLAMTKRKEIREKLSPYFQNIFLDTEVR